MRDQRTTGAVESVGDSAAISTQEVERKWLVRELPDLLGVEGKEIVQGYIVATPDQEVRIRRKGDSFTQTVKSGGGLVREETEVPLTQEQYVGLWETTAGRRLEKTRYKIGHGDFTIELDLYKGAHEGLMVAEVEFSTVQEAEAFSPPAWFGTEVTEDKRYKNKNLALSGSPAAV